MNIYAKAAKQNALLAIFLTICAAIICLFILKALGISHPLWTIAIYQPLTMLAGWAWSHKYKKSCTALFQEVYITDQDLPTLYDTESYDGEMSLCSGYGIYPNGKKCTGCSDCTDMPGYKYFGPEQKN